MDKQMNNVAAKAMVKATDKVTLGGMFKAFNDGFWDGVADMAKTYSQVYLACMLAIPVIYVIAKKTGKLKDEDN